MTRILTALVVILALARPAHADPVDAAVEQYRMAAHIPGVAIAIAEGGRVVRLNGYGTADLETGAPVTADTAFQTASASKIFTGVLLMRLSERGVIDLDEPITDILHEAPTSWKGVTLRRLATHSSGLPEGLGLPQTATSAEIAAAAMTRPASL